MNEVEFKGLEDYLMIRMNNEFYAYAYLDALSQYDIITKDQFVELSSKITMSKLKKDEYKDIEK